MKNITVAALVAAPLLILALAVPSFAADPAPTTYKDGTTTTSTGKGTCSGLFAQQRLERRPDILEQYRLTGGVRMNVIALQ
jgi:hypothetical protein